MQPEDRWQENKRELQAQAQTQRGGVHPGAPGDVHIARVEIAFEDGSVEVKEIALHGDSG
jgi:hypothetical protein